MWVCAVKIYCQSFNLSISVENHRKLNRTKIQLRSFFPMLLLFVLTHTPHITFYRYAKCTISTTFFHPRPHMCLSVFAFYYMCTVSNKSSNFMYSHYLFIDYFIDFIYLYFVKQTFKLTKRLLDLCAKEKKHQTKWNKIKQITIIDNPIPTKPQTNVEQKNCPPSLSLSNSRWTHSFVLLLCNETRIESNLSIDFLSECNQYYKLNTMCDEFFVCCEIAFEKQYYPLIVIITCPIINSLNVCMPKHVDEILVYFV